MRFSLRALLIAMTLIAIYLGYYAYGLRSMGEFLTGKNWRLHLAPDSQTIAKQVREGVSGLPAHTFTDERLFELSDRFYLAGYREVTSNKLADQFFCRVKLSDGSETSVGFWTYSQHGDTGVTYVIFAHDSYLAGPADQRWKERFALQDVYDAIIAKIQLDAERNARRVSPAGHAKIQRDLDGE